MLQYNLDTFVASGVWPSARRKRSFVRHRKDRSVELKFFVATVSKVIKIRICLVFAQTRARKNEKASYVAILGASKLGTVD